MTTPEHAMVGICGVLAAGLHRRYTWRLAALAGFSATTPDWDATTFLASIQLFDRGHRVWGHNLFFASLIGALLGALDFRWDLSAQIYRWLARLLGQPTSEHILERRSRSIWVWMLVGVLASLSHLPADMFVSGGTGLSDWGVQLFWPFSSDAYVWPAIRWGDPTPTIVFVVAGAAMVRWPDRIRAIAVVTIVLLGAYIATLGSLRASGLVA